MARNEPQVNLRIPSALKAELEASARLYGRSLTAEIVHRLNGTFAGQRRTAEKLKLLAEGGIAPREPFDEQGVSPQDLNDTLQDILARLHLMSLKIEELTVSAAPTRDQRKSTLERDDDDILPAEVSQTISRGVGRLTAIREWRGLTVSQLANKSGFKIAGLKELEAGRGLPGEIEAELLARALNVPIEWVRG